MERSRCGAAVAVVVKKRSSAKSGGHKSTYTPPTNQTTAPDKGNTHTHALGQRVSNSAVAFSLNFAELLSVQFYVNIIRDRDGGEKHTHVPADLFLNGTSRYYHMFNPSYTFTTSVF